MKLIEKKIAPSNKSFTVYRNRTPCLAEEWHYHQEYELIYILEGKGLRFIGDDVREFSGGELALIGPNLPHLWQNSLEYYDNIDLNSDVIVVQFNHNFLGENFFNIHEMAVLKKLLEKSKGGLEFLNHQLKLNVAKQLMQLIELSSFPSVRTLLEILEILALTSEVHPIASTSFQVNPKSNDSVRINKIYQYVLNNYQEHITLEEVADIANLGVSPFCRFFKKATNKSFLEFLNEVRIGHACKLLIEGSQSIGQIVYSCGFNSQTHFNKQFKKIKKRSPVEFRRYFMIQ
ncbi:MAG: AraC family transcriptional regulator [Cyclobacteriaceae bacterium]